MNKNIAGVILFLLFFANITYGQTDTTTSIVKTKKTKSPVVASVMSAVLPGSGQIYNGKWYKVPFVYAALAGSYYYFHLNDTIYQLYRNDLINLTLDSNYTPVSGVSDLSYLKQKYDRYRRSRDLAFLIGVGVWSLNIIDAYVDAELSDFDVSPDLTMHISPQVYLVDNRYTYGVSITFKF